MHVVIKLNVAVQVVPKSIEAPVRRGIQFINNLAEDSRQQVFAAKRKGRRDRTNII